MQNITLKNISKSYPSKTLFERVSFSIGAKDRVAIIGENGVGKSSLLKIMAGIEAPDEGTIQGEKYSVAYIAQDFIAKDCLYISDYLASVGAKPRVFEIIKRFNLLSQTQLQSGLIENLSGGQKRIIEIAAILSTAPRYLCIDEPENHLDIYSRNILTSLLTNYHGGVIFVSHDRFLINTISNKILELANQNVTLNSMMSYEEFLLARQNTIERDIGRWKHEERKLTKLTETVKLLERRAKVNSDISTTYQMKKRELEKRKEAHGDRPIIEKSVSKISTGNLLSKSGKMILMTTELAFGYPHHPTLIEETTLNLRYGERVFLLGRNGSGKSTFINLISQKLTPSSGAMTVGNNVKVSVFTQHSNLDDSLSPLHHLTDLSISEEKARAMLAGILFSRLEAESPLRYLSGGQLQRLRFLLLFSGSPEFIIMDEPTNNLDPTTWNLLVTLMNEFDGSILISTHDQEFIRNIEHPSLWVLKNKRVQESWKPLEETIATL